MDPMTRLPLPESRSGLVALPHFRRFGGLGPVFVKSDILK
jgi:hypothetical protein